MGKTTALIVVGLAATAIAAGTGTAGPARSSASATGSGHLTYFDTNEQQEGHRTFSFSAHQTGGGATGTAHVNNRAQDLKQDIDVDCLDVEGNNAWLGGVITRSTVSQFVGRRIVFAVQDNGEGKSSTPDRISFIFRQGSDPMPSTDCNVFHPAPTREVQDGNIQVRG